MAFKKNKNNCVSKVAIDRCNKGSLVIFIKKYITHTNDLFLVFLDKLNPFNLMTWSRYIVKIEELDGTCSMCTSVGWQNISLLECNSFHYLPSSVY